MWNTIQHGWPSYIAVLLGAAHIRRGVAAKIAVHANQVNKVIQWALAQPQISGKQDDGTQS